MDNPEGRIVVKRLFAASFILAGLIFALGFTAQPVGAVRPPTNTPRPDPVSVDVCHATASDGNPFVLITVSVHSVDDANGLNGHGGHEGDSWLSFVFDGVTYPGQGEFPGGCGDEGEDPTATPTYVPTYTPTATLVPDDTPTNTPEPTATYLPAATREPEPECESEGVYRMVTLIDLQAPDWYWGVGTRNGTCWIVMHEDGTLPSVERQKDVCSVCSHPDFEYVADLVLYDGYVSIDCKGNLYYEDPTWKPEWYRTDWRSICREASCLSSKTNGR